MSRISQSEQHGADAIANVKTSVAVPVSLLGLVALMKQNQTNQTRPDQYAAL